MKKHDIREEITLLGRRAFLSKSSLILLAASGTLSGCRSLSVTDGMNRPVLRIGVVTDVHHANKPHAGTRYYRESMTKMRECVQAFNQAKADFALELGDFVDAADSVKEETGYLRTIVSEFSRYRGERHYVLGNHCVWSLTKKQFLRTCRQDRSYYSFDRGGFHFVVLDACFRKDGVAYGHKNYEWTDTDIPAEEREWLKADLEAASNPAILFIHQRLDVSNHYGVYSAPAVREILESSKKVLAVFQGHSHVNDYKEIGGIHYCSLAAMIEGSGTENNAYTILELQADGSMRVEGFRKQMDYSLSPSYV